MLGVSFQEAGCENDRTLLEELINSSNFHPVQHKLQIYLEMLNFGLEQLVYTIHAAEQGHSWQNNQHEAQVGSRSQEAD